MTDKKYLVSEIFGNTIQGEGQYAGIPTVWVRFFNCNLQCSGFGQPDPTNPDTYDLPYKELGADIKAGKRPDIKCMADLPVFETGCDSSYSWSAMFKGLQLKLTASEISDMLVDLNRNEWNPHGSFKHPNTGQPIHLCFTGGEPLMKNNQVAVVSVLEELQSRASGDFVPPKYITFETNGTQMMGDALVDHFGCCQYGTYKEVLLSVSPKLWTVAGEVREKAIRPEVIKQYGDLDYISKTPIKVQLKFVMGKETRQWDELNEILAIEEFRNLFVGSDVNSVWIMPVGATSNGQDAVAAEVAEMAIARGFNVATRVHVYLFGNVVGK